MNTSSQLAARSALDPSIPQLSSSKDELKTHFITREGIYKQMTLSEYSRPNKVPLSQGGNNVSSAPVRVSFLSINPTTSAARSCTDNELANGDLPSLRNITGSLEAHVEADSPTYSVMDDGCNSNERICFNVGRELYVFVYRGVHAAVDLNKPVDKRVYKGTYPTSHDFNQETATASSCSLIIGFSAGQIQLIDPFQKELQVSRLYNEDRFIDKTAVTCLKWIPGRPQCFLASHASGNAYVYNSELTCNQTPPVFQTFKQGDGFAVYTCKTKASRNPVYRWAIGAGALYEFAFSTNNDNKLFATVSQDGFLRIFNYHAMELLAYMKSYFGGLLCLAWSPDSRYIVTGGEDDLITVYSVAEKRVICRGQGHKSWISKVAFDPYTCSFNDTAHCCVPIDLGSDEDLRASSLSSSGLLFKGSVTGTRAFLNSQFNGPPLAGATQPKFSSNPATSLPSAITKNIGNVGSTSSLRTGVQPNMPVGTQRESFSSVSVGCCNAHSAFGTSYRIGSVGHDTQLCLWDLTEDVLRQMPPSSKYRTSTVITVAAEPSFTQLGTSEASKLAFNDTKDRQHTKQRKHKRGFSFAAKLTSGTHDRWNRNHSSSLVCEKEKKESAVVRLLGTPVCPRMDEVTVIEPLICKKISHEKLTGLVFREDCLVTACQEGFILTWARPGKATAQRNTVNSPVPMQTTSGTVV